MKVTLTRWVEQGWLHEVEVNPDDINSLLKLASQNILEATERTHSTQWQFNILYAAIVNLATCALRSKGYRVSSSASHYYVLQSLEHTIRMDSDTIALLDSFRKKRNTSTYDFADVITENDVNEIQKVTLELRRDVETFVNEG